MPISLNPYWKAAYFLEETLCDTKTTWQFPFLKYPAGSLQAEDAWLAAEQVQRFILNDFVRRWIDTKIIPRMSEEQMYWFQLRLVAAYKFLYQFASDHSTSIFPFPEMSQSDFLHKMLIDWWEDVGVNEATFYKADSDYGTRHIQN